MAISSREIYECVSLKSIVGFDQNDVSGKNVCGDCDKSRNLPEDELLSQIDYRQ